METYFEDAAARWDTPQRIRRAQRIAQEFRRHIPFRHCGLAVEFGCGTGLVGLNLADLADRLILTDPEPAMLDILRQKLDGLVSGPRPGLLCQPLDIPLPKELHCDLIFHSMALHHTQDAELALRHAWESLTPGGCLCFADLNPEDGHFHDDHPDFHGYNGFDQSWLRRIMHRVGFENVDSQTFLQDTKLIHGQPYPFSLFWMCGIRPHSF